jgi:hypothetical protein
VRLDDRQRRALARLQKRLDPIQRELGDHPLQAVKDALVASISRGRLLCELADAYLLASPDLRQEGGLAKFSGWLHNRVRRDSELLVLLQEKVERDSTPSLAEYLASKEREQQEAAAQATAASTEALEADEGGDPEDATHSPATTPVNEGDGNGGNDDDHATD